jgi:hypothetical protein
VKVIAKNYVLCKSCILFNFFSSYKADWQSQLLVLQNAIPGFVRALNRFEPLKKLDVMFIDNNNNTEGAVDNGGPTREFFRLLVDQTVNSHLFEGAPTAKYLSLSTIGLLQILYWYFNIMFTTCVVGKLFMRTKYAMGL